MFLLSSERYGCRYTYKKESTILEYFRPCQKIKVFECCRKSNGVGPGKRLSCKPGGGVGGVLQENGLQFQIDNIAENSRDVISTKKL